MGAVTPAEALPRGWKNPTTRSSSLPPLHPARSLSDPARGTLPGPWPAPLPLPALLGLTGEMGRRASSSGRRVPRGLRFSSAW